MNRIKIVAASLLAVLFVSSAQAQLGEPQSILTSNLVESAATAVTQRFSAVNSPNLVFQITATGAGAGVTNDGTLTLQKSVDGSSWTTGATLVFATGGVTPTTTITNLATGGVPYWRLTTADNTANAAKCLVVITAAKDNANVSSVGTTVKVGGVSYTPSYVAEAQTVKAAATQAALTQSVKAAETQADRKSTRLNSSH
jgi:hypothetical protein